METRASGSFENRDFLALIDFVLSAGKHSEGFADIDMDGRISSPMYRSTLTNSRMTFVMAAASLLGVEQARPALEAGVKCLREELHDKSYGGYSRKSGRRCLVIPVRSAVCSGRTAGPEAEAERGTKAGSTRDRPPC